MRIPARILAPALMMAVVIPAFVFVMMSATQFSTRPIIEPGSDSGEFRTEVYPESQNFHDTPPYYWQSHIRGQCERLGMTTFIRGKDYNRNLFRHILVDDRNKLMYCQIPKVATTTWRRIFIFLTGKLGGTDFMSLSADDVHHKHDVHLTYLSKLSRDDIMFRLKHYYKFVFVREPMERVLSAFRNKFASKTTSSGYFRKAFGKRIVKHYRHNYNRTEKLDVETLDLKFTEFIDYIIDTSRKVEMNEHWERFHELCHPCLINYDFIGKLEEIDRDSQFLLEKTGLNHVVKFPTRKDARYANRKTDDYMREYYSQIPKATLHKLLKEYEADFAIFNYTVPEIMKHLLL